MNAKAIAAAVAIALGLPGTASAQSSSSGANTRSAPASPSTAPGTGSSTGARSGSSPVGSGTPVPGTSIGTSSVPSGAGASPESSAGASGKCEKLTGNEKADCLRMEALATSGSGGGTTDRPGPESTGMGR